MMGKRIVAITLLGGLIVGGFLLLRRRLAKKDPKEGWHRRFGWSDSFLRHLAKVRESLAILDQGALELFDDKLFIIEFILDNSVDDKSTEEICNGIYVAMAARNSLWGLDNQLPIELVSESIFDRQEAIINNEMKIAASCKSHLQHGVAASGAIMDVLRVKLHQKVKIA